MVPQRGATSNSETPSLAEQRKHLEELLRPAESEYNEDVEQLFNTLAEWNDYLENHVPAFQKPREPEL